MSPVVFSVDDIALRLKLHRSRHEWRGTCPACGYPESFVLGTGKSGRPIGWCASCQNTDAIARLLNELQGGSAGHDPARGAERHAAEVAAREARVFERAMALWNSSEPLPGTIAEAYLDARGLVHLVASAALRYRGDCPHPSCGRLPALVALMQGVDGGPVEIHRTFLKRDGSGKAEIDPPRASLGSVRGGAVRLVPLDQVLAAGGELVIGEGVETSASAGLLLSLPAWSAVSAGNLERVLALPPEVRRVVIASDRDRPGRRAATAAWHRWMREGRRVRISTPKGGGDFNDLLVQRQQHRGLRDE